MLGGGHECGFSLNREVNEAEGVPTYERASGNAPNPRKGLDNQS